MRSLAAPAPVAAGQREPDLDHGRAGVPGGVRHRLGDDAVRGDLHRRGQGRQRLRRVDLVRAVGRRGAAQNVPFGRVLDVKLADRDSRACRRLRAAAADQPK